MDKVKHCCEKMRYFLKTSSKKMDFDSDDILYYSLKFDEYGIVIHDGGESYITIEYCPWCGQRLPNSKRDLWFDELEKIGIENPIEEEIPEEFSSDKWWKKLIN